MRLISNGLTNVSFALSALPNAKDIHNFPSLVAAIKAERNCLRKSWEGLSGITTRKFDRILVSKQHPNTRSNLFDLGDFQGTHRRLMCEVMNGLSNGEEWSEHYFPPLVFLEVLHVQMMSVWECIFDIGHFEQLQTLDCTNLLK